MLALKSFKKYRDNVFLHQQNKDWCLLVDWKNMFVWNKISSAAELQSSIVIHEWSDISSKFYSHVNKGFIRIHCKWVKGKG